MAADSRQPLLSEKTYDNDAVEITSDREMEDDSASDLDFHDGPPVADDRKILDEPEEDARLLGQTSRFDAVQDTMRRTRDKNTTAQDLEKRRKRATRRAARRAQSTTGSELGYEMEGGFKDSSSRSSSEHDLDRAASYQNEKV